MAVYRFLMATVGPNEADDCFQETFLAALRAYPDLKHGDNLRAWVLATCPDPQFRDAPRAVELAKKATALAPKGRGYWATLGAAHYRAGNWQDAIEALSQSLARSDDDSGWALLFLAMAHAQLGHKDQARQWYDKAIVWTEKSRSINRELIRFRAEAEEVLGIKSAK